MSRPAILIRLRADHRRVLRELDAVDRALSAPRARTAAAREPLAALGRVLERLGRQFDTHMAAEDELLFPALAAVLPEARPGIEGLTSEHAELRGLLARLVALLATPASDRRDEALRVQWSDFSELLRIHLRKEESLVFHIAEPVVPAEDWQRIEARRFPRSTATRTSLGSRTRKGSSPMKRIVPLLMTLSLAVAALSCGGKSDTASSAAGNSSAAATTASSASATAAVSKYDSGPRAGESPVDKAAAEQGEALFKNKGCSACHAMGRRLTGPDLAGVSMRRTAIWIENQILHPDVMVKEDPISHALFAQFALQMPKQGLTPEEARAVIEYFKHMDHEAAEHSAESHH